MELRTIRQGTPEYDQMKQLRLKVLLEPIGIPRSYINEAEERKDLLLGAFDGETITGCCVLTARNETTVQLRQMAVDTRLQGKGIGAALLSFAEQQARERGFRVLMLHARAAVCAFYAKCGYQVAGPQFEEVGIPHFRMEKSL